MRGRPTGANPGRPRPVFYMTVNINRDRPRKRGSRGRPMSSAWGSYYGVAAWGKRSAVGPFGIAPRDKLPERKGGR